MHTIAHVIENLGLGGAQSMMFELYYAINKYYPQYQQQVLCLNNRRGDDTFVNSYGVPPIINAREHKRLYSLISSYKDPFVIFHKLAASRQEIMGRINERGNIPNMVINHTFFRSHQWEKMSGKINVMVAVSDHMKRHLRQWYPKIKIYRIYNSVNADRYEDIPARSVNKKGRFYTGRINRICTWKHSDQWVRFCTDVKLPVKMVHEYIGGGINSHLSKVGKVRNRNVVKYLGSISDFNKKVSILKSWDVFFYETRRDEGISVSVLEALASGVPVICSNHYGNKEIIVEGVNGYVFNDYKHAGKVLSDLINNKDKLKELKKTTKEHYLEKLDAKHTVGQYIELAKSICDRRECIVINEQEKMAVSINKEEAERQNQILMAQKAEEEKRQKELDNYNQFTILSASYNKGPYLQDWAKSILYQTQVPTEVVLVDDFSTDNTVKIVSQIEKDFSKAKINFKFIRNSKRLFCGSSYRVAMKAAEGSYFGVIDADDMIVEDAVEYIMGLYKKHKDIAWIYTQYQTCNVRMNPIHKGLSRAVPPGQTLLETGERRKHTYSHWRTCSKRHPKLNKIFPKKLRSAVDKFMGYRLEEFAPGAFVDRVCYLYRERVSRCISGTEKTKEDWMKVVKEAKSRRSRYKLTAHPIITL